MAAAAPDGPIVVPPGSLIVVGTGIRTAGQLTIEALAALRAADEVVHLVADPVGAELVRRMHPGHERSLLPLYEEGKPRRQTYTEMVEVILDLVRSGARVSAAFYGHPGVFARAPHEAVRRARDEGFDARMLPGISAEDCLFADLGVDPAVGGCLSYEATEFLLYEHPIDPSSNLILWQVGGLGNWDHQRRYRPKGLDLLIDKLARVYGSDHEVVVYEAAMFPGCEPDVVRVAVGDLETAPLRFGCTVYVPPAQPLQPDRAMSARFREL